VYFDAIQAVLQPSSCSHRSLLFYLLRFVMRRANPFLPMHFCTPCQGISCKIFRRHHSHHRARCRHRGGGGIREAACCLLVIVIDVRPGRLEGGNYFPRICLSLPPPHPTNLGICSSQTLHHIFHEEARVVVSYLFLSCRNRRRIRLFFDVRQQFRQQQRRQLPAFQVVLVVLVVFLLPRPPPALQGSPPAGI
jgi:hypothetical protein